MTNAHNSDITIGKIRAWLAAHHKVLAKRANEIFMEEGRGAIVLDWDFDPPYSYDSLGSLAQNVLSEDEKAVSSELAEYIEFYDPTTEYVVVIDLPGLRSAFCGICKINVGDTLGYLPQWLFSTESEDCLSLPLQLLLDSRFQAM